MAAILALAALTYTSYFRFALLQPLDAYSRAAGYENRDCTGDIVLHVEVPPARPATFAISEQGLITPFPDAPHDHLVRCVSYRLHPDCELQGFIEVDCDDADHESEGFEISTPEWADIVSVSREELTDPVGCLHLSCKGAPQVCHSIDSWLQCAPTQDLLCVGMPPLLQCVSCVDC